MMPHSNYPNTFYRVSLKAIIRNEKGEVLVVQERENSWGLPGGGIDHGETAEAALARELFEEVAYEGEFRAAVKDTVTFYVPSKQAWAFWIAYDVETASDEFGVGKDAAAVAFMDPRTFKNSTRREEQLVYKFCVDQSAPFSRFTPVGPAS